MIVYLFTKVVVVTAIKLPHFTSAGSLSVSLEFPFYREFYSSKVFAFFESSTV